MKALPPILLKLLPNYQNDHQGVSFVICNTEKGTHAIEAIGLRGQAVEYDKVVLHNGGLTNKSSIPKERDAFWAEFFSIDDKSKVIQKYSKPYLPNLKKKVISFVKPNEKWYYHPTIDSQLWWNTTELCPAANPEEDGTFSGYAELYAVTLSWKIFALFAKSGIVRTISWFATSD